MTALPMNPVPERMRTRMLLVSRVARRLRTTSQSRLQQIQAWPKGFCSQLPLFMGIEDVTAAMRTAGLVRQHELIAAGAQQQAHSLANRCRRIVSVHERLLLRPFDPDTMALFVFDHEFEQAIVEGKAWSCFYLAQALAQTVLAQCQRAVVAIGIIARFSKEGMRRPGAAATAYIGVIAVLAKSPEVTPGAVPKKTQ